MCPCTLVKALARQAAMEMPSRPLQVGCMALRLQEAVEKAYAEELVCEVAAVQLTKATRHLVKAEACRICPRHACRARHGF